MALFLSDDTLASRVSTLLTKKQTALLEHRDLSSYREQSVIPKCTITYDALRKLTNRTKIKQAFITAMTKRFESHGLLVEHRSNSIRVTKPLPEIESEFDSIEALAESLK